MVQSVSLYTLMFGLIGGLAVLALLIRLGTGQHAALVWIAAALGLGGFNNWLYAYWDAGPATRAILYLAGPLTILCVAQAVRLAFRKGRTPRTILVPIGLLVALSWLLMALGAPLRLEAVPSLLGTILAYADAVVLLWRRQPGLVRNGLLASLLVMMSTAIIRIPFFPALLEAGRAYPDMGPSWLTSYLLIVSSIAVPSVVLFLIAAIVTGVIGTYRNRSERDQLTGLLNRRAFDILLDQHDGEVGVLIAADIDHFKRVNDSYGHGVGDAVIAHFAQLMKEASPIAARIGGEEFVIALPGGSLLDGSRVAEDLRARFRGWRHGAFDPDERISASFGVAPYSARMPMKQGLEQADRALYRAKRVGRDCVAVFGTDQIERREVDLGTRSG